MNPSQEELSGLLDGELDASRAKEVRRRIDEDPALRAEFEALVRMDQGLSREAEQAAFTPEIVFPAGEASESKTWSWPAGMAIACGLLIVRFAPKLFDLAAMGIAVQIGLCAAVCFVVAAMVRDAQASGTLPTGHPIRG